MREFIPGVSPCYSPSSSGLFLECQRSFLLKRQGWTLPKPNSKGDVAAAMGTAFHLFAEGYMLAIKGGLEPLNEELTENALKNYHDWYNEVECMGFDDKAQASLVDADQIIRAMCLAFPKQEYVSELYEIIDCEVPLPLYGGSIPDLVLRDSDGVVVSDYKTRVYSNAYYKSRDINDFPDGRQMLHYTWALGLLYGEVVDRCQMIMIPRNKRPTIEVHTFHVDVKYRDEVWLPSSIQLWENMAAVEKGLVDPIHADKHGNNFGPCPFKAACLDHRLNINSMKSDYIQIERRKR